MIDLNYLNHDFVFHRQAWMTDGFNYYCKICKINILYWEYLKNWEKSYVVLYSTPATKLLLNCNEVVIKSIIE